MIKIPKSVITEVNFQPKIRFVRADECYFTYQEEIIIANPEPSEEIKKQFKQRNNKNKNKNKNKNNKK